MIEVKRTEIIEKIEAGTTSEINGEKVAEEVAQAKGEAQKQEIIVPIVLIANINLKIKNNCTKHNTRDRSPKTVLLA
jgi:hypothetical protein